MQKMKLPKNRESGQALIMVLILLALGSLLIVPGLNLSYSALTYHQTIESKTLEMYSADSGLEYVLCKLYSNPGGYTDIPLQESFSLNGRTIDVATEYWGGGVYTVNSTATSASGRSTTIQACITMGAGSFAYAVASEEDMTLQYTTVDSLPDPNEGNIHSNKNIELTGCTINGSASAVGTISGGQVNGMITENCSPSQFPGDYSELYETMAKMGDNCTGDYSILGGTEPLGPIYIDGNLRVEDATVVLGGTVYVTGNITTENSNLDGDETVCAEGKIYLEQGDVRSNVIPIIISLKVDGDGIVAEKECVLDGVLYAPYSNVRLEDIELYGAVGGKTVEMERCTIIYAKELHGRPDLPGGELNTISYSYK